MRTAYVMGGASEHDDWVERKAQEASRKENLKDQVVRALDGDIPLMKLTQQVYARACKGGHKALQRLGNAPTAPKPLQARNRCGIGFLSAVRVPQRSGN